MAAETELAIRREELALRRAEITLQERAERRQRSEANRAAWISALGALLVAATVAVSAWQLVDNQHDSVAAQQQANADTQARTRATLQNEYDAMVQELGSPGAAVQINAVRRLVQFVEDQDHENYVPGTCAQFLAAGTLAQTLEVYIADVRDPDSGVRAAQELVDLSKAGSLPPPPPRLAKQCRGGHDIFLENAYLRSANLSAWKLPGPATFGLYHDDLKGADLAYLDVIALGGHSSLKNSTLDCANLSHAQLGTTELTHATLRRADLENADLSRVVGLTSAAQLAGATINAATRLPRIGQQRLSPQVLAAQPAPTVTC